MHSKSPLYLLDSFSAKDLDQWEAQKDKILRYHWDLYSDLSYQRHKIQDQICMTLLNASTGSYAFKGWQRQVRYKYSLTPLSPRGSLVEPGGRFNIPDVNPTQIPPFPALYIAEDKETTLQEAGQRNNNSPQGLSSLDLALIKKDSISIVSVSGKLGSVIDLTSPKTLITFLNLIKKFSIARKIVQDAKKIGLAKPKRIQTLKELIESLLEPDWRSWPMQFDIPANCQIFGQLTANAGIEGILYPSKFTNKKCLAIYPQNFDSESFINVNDEFPDGTIARLDATVWQTLKATF